MLSIATVKKSLSAMAVLYDLDGVVEAELELVSLHPVNRLMARTRISAIDTNFFMIKPPIFVMYF